MMKCQTVCDAITSTHHTTYAKSPVGGNMDGVDTQGQFMERMKMRLIDADALWKNITKKYDYAPDWDGIAETIDEQPTIEPERKKGKWILHKDGSGTCDQCSIKQIAVWDYDGWQNFCGHCGSDMRGDTSA